MLCHRFAKNGKLILKTISISYASSILFNVWPGIYEMLTSGDSAFPARISTFYVYQPSAFDLTFEMLFNFVVLAIIAMVQIAYDPLIYIIFLNMLLVSSIIIGQIDDFKEALLDPAISPRDTKYRMQAIILMILKYNMWDPFLFFLPMTMFLNTTDFRCIGKLSKCINKISFVQISFSYLFLILGIFNMITVNTYIFQSNGCLRSFLNLNILFYRSAIWHRAPMSVWAFVKLLHIALEEQLLRYR